MTPRGEQAPITSAQAAFWEGQYEENRLKIFNYLNRRVSVEDAENLTNETFTRVMTMPFERIQTNIQNEPTYPIRLLYIVAHNLAIDHHRNSENRLRLPMDDLFDQMDQRQPSPEEIIQKREDMQKLNNALQHLTHEQQRVFLLFKRDGFSQEEIAERIGKKTGAVKAIYMRAKNSLKRKVNSEES